MTLLEMPFLEFVLFPPPPSPSNLFSSGIDSSAMEDVHDDGDRRVLSNLPGASFLSKQAPPKEMKSVGYSYGALLKIFNAALLGVSLSLLPPIEPSLR